MAIPLAITSMLVMYTLKSSISEELPATSYVKFIDIWLLNGMLMPFVILIMIVLIEHLPDGSKVIEYPGRSYTVCSLNFRSLL